MGRRVDGCRFRLNFNGHPSSAHRSPGMSARSWRLEAEAFNARASEAIRTAILEVPISDEETGISGRLIDFEDETAVAYGESKVADEGDIVPFEVGGGWSYTPKTPTQRCRARNNFPACVVESCWSQPGSRMRRRSTAPFECDRSRLCFARSWRGLEARLICSRGSAAR